MLQDATLHDLLVERDQLQGRLVVAKRRSLLGDLGKSRDVAQIVERMRASPDDAAVQVMACRALGSEWRRVDRYETHGHDQLPLPPQGAVELVLAALARFKNDPVLQGWGFRAVRWMARARPENKKAFSEGGVVQMACTALAVHAADAVAQAWACGVMIPLLNNNAAPHHHHDTKKDAHGSRGSHGHGHHRHHHHHHHKPARDEVLVKRNLKVAGKPENVLAIVGLLRPGGAAAGDAELLELVWAAIHQLAAARQQDANIKEHLLAAKVLERLPETLKHTAPAFGRAVAAAIGAARWLAEKDPAVQRKLRPMLIVLGAAEKNFMEQTQTEPQELYRVSSASRWLRAALNSGS